LRIRGDREVVTVNRRVILPPKDKHEHVIDAIHEYGGYSFVVGEFRYTDDGIYVTAFKNVDEIRRAVDEREAWRKEHQELLRYHRRFGTERGFE
jgi:hypothetical protein